MFTASLSLDILEADILTDKMCYSGNLTVRRKIIRYDCPNECAVEGSELTPNGPQSRLSRHRHRA